jgi:hypothetical protein
MTLALVAPALPASAGVPAHTRHTQATPQSDPCGRFSRWWGEVYYNNCAPTPYMVDVWYEVAMIGDPHEYWACLARGTNDLGNTNQSGNITASPVGPCAQPGTWTPIG